jgi:hypothetical protein
MLKKMSLKDGMVEFVLHYLKMILRERKENEVRMWEKKNAPISSCSPDKKQLGVNVPGGSVVTSTKREKRIVESIPPKTIYDFFFLFFFFFFI